MEMETEREIDIGELNEIMKELVSMAKVKHSLKEAVDAGVPMHFVNHRTYLVPTSMINERLHVERMPRYVVPLLRELGWERNSRCVCVNGKPERYLSCWIYRE